MLISKKHGFTLIELLVVIAIIAILAAILFPVFARAREKARQTTCTSNQRQIAALASMYVQDHEETMPISGEFWSGINADPGVLVCPTLGKSYPNGYVFNANCSGVSIGEFEDPTKAWMTADGKTVSTTAEVNIAEDSMDTNLRHSGQIIISYLDGHVGTQNTLPFVVPFTTSGLDMWFRADAITGLKTNDEIQSWPASWGKVKMTPMKLSGKKYPLFSETGFSGGKPCATFHLVNIGGYFNTDYTKSLNDFTIVTVFSVSDTWTGWPTLIIKGQYNNSNGISFTTIANDGSFKFLATAAYNVPAEVMSLSEFNWTSTSPHVNSSVYWNTDRFYTLQRSGSMQNVWSHGVAKTPFAGKIKASDNSMLQLFAPSASNVTSTNSGKLAEIAVFNRALSTDEIDSIHAYIKRRYSL